MTKINQFLTWLASLFSNKISEEDKIKYNIANYKPKVQEIIQQKPNIVDKTGKLFNILF